MIEPDFRPLTDGERATLAFLLTDAVPDVNALRARLAVAEARRSCACGCPTITLRVDPQLAPQARARAGSSAHQVPVAESISAPGSAAHPSLLILFTRDGWLDELELAAMDPGNIVTVLPPTDAWVPPLTLGARRGED